MQDSSASSGQLIGSPLLLLVTDFTGRRVVIILGVLVIMSLNLRGYLESIQPDALVAMYSSVWPCLAVFRCLSPVAQQYVVRLLFLKDSLPLATVESWQASGHRSKHQKAIEDLLKFELVKRSVGSSGEPVVQLQPAFTRHLRGVVTSGKWTFSGNYSEEVDQQKPSAEELAKYAQDQWEAVLLFLVGARHSPPPAPREVSESPLNIVQLLTSAGLMSGAEAAIIGG